MAYVVKKIVADAGVLQEFGSTLIASLGDITVIPAPIRPEPIQGKRSEPSEDLDSDPIQDSHSANKAAMIEPYIGQKRAYDYDPFDIKKNKNCADRKNKCRVLKTKVDYSAERSPYADWCKKSGEFDPIDPDNIREGSQPWDLLPMSEAQEEQWEALQAIRPMLKGRQKQIVELLVEGETNQSEIGRRIGMDQRHVARALLAIQKKILGKMV